jgi:hypothetical protein
MIEYSPVAFELWPLNINFLEILGKLVVCFGAGVYRRLEVTAEYCFQWLSGDSNRATVD